MTYPAGGLVVMVVVGNWNFMCTTGVEDIEMIGFAQVD